MKKYLLSLVLFLVLFLILGCATNGDATHRYEGESDAWEGELTVDVSEDDDQYIYEVSFELNPRGEYTHEEATEITYELNLGDLYSEKTMEYEEETEVLALNISEITFVTDTAFDPDVPITIDITWQSEMEDRSETIVFN